MPERRLIARIARGAGVATLALLVAAIGIWGALLLEYAGPRDDLARKTLVVGFAVAAAATLVALFLRRWRWRWRAIGAYGVLCVGLALLWSSIEPTNDRDWQTDLAVLAYATVDGDKVTVHNIRNFDYRSETDYTPAYYDKTFNLRELRSVDIVTSYWAGPAIAHVFVSFGFPRDDYVAVSIEVRKPKGEAYSTLKGFFRQYELIYVVGDERDLIRLRTNYRRDPPEDVYIYRVKGSTEVGRRLFMKYMDEINALRTQPEFYNTLTTNCTTSIWMNAAVNAGRVPLSWKILASGYVPEYLYEQGRLETMGLSFPELQQRAHVNARAQAADKAADFSRRIRAPGETSGASFGWRKVRVSHRGSGERLAVSSAWRWPSDRQWRGVL
jgi:hypothetical protein